MKLLVMQQMKMGFEPAKANAGIGTDPTIKSLQFLITRLPHTPHTHTHKIEEDYEKTTEESS